MDTKKVLASAFITTALVLTPVGVASATPVTDNSPAAVEVRHDNNHRDHDRGHHDRGRDGRDRDRHGDNHWRDRDNHRNDQRRHDHHWTPPRTEHRWQGTCFWLGPFWVCLPW